MTASTISNPQSRIQNLLCRPIEQRVREFKYRFGQSVVFGLPVLGLQWYGPVLGPADADRWVSLLQALLAGWVLYVNLGMFFEGMLTFGRAGGRADLIVASIAVVLYCYSLLSAVHGIAVARLWYRPLLFGAMVVLLMIWSGLRWWQTSRRAAQTVTG